MTVRTAQSVADVIDDRKAAGLSTFVGYLPIGFPNLTESIRAAVALAESGANAIELGIPYTDPVMDGPVIQAATVTSLAAGFRLRDVFTAIREIRSATDVPLLVMTYWNPILQYGVDRFADDFADAGGSGLITPDITPDSAADWISASERTGLDRVFLAAPTSTEPRLRLVAEATRGFVYAVSTMGITGERAAMDQAARGLVGRIREAGAERICVGIGVTTAEHVRDICTYADGAIVGTALVRALGERGVAGMAELAAQLAEGAKG